MSEACCTDCEGPIDPLQHMQLGLLYFCNGCAALRVARDLANRLPRRPGPGGSCAFREEPREKPEIYKTSRYR